MKIINGSNRVIMAPFGESMITIMPKNVSGDVVASKELVRAIITSGRTNEVGLVTYSSAELQLINEVSGAAPFIHEDIDKAINKLIPEGVKPVIEQRVIQGGETVLVQTEQVSPETEAETSITDSEEIKSLVEASENMKIEIKKLKERNVFLEKSKADLEEQISSLKNQEQPTVDVEEYETKITQLKATNSNLEKLLNEAQTENAKLTESVEKLKTENGKLQKSSTDSSSKKDEEIAKLKSQIAEQASTISRLETVEAKNSDDSDSQKVIDDLTKKLEEANAGFERFRKLLNNTVKANELSWDAANERYIKMPSTTV